MSISRDQGCVYVLFHVLVSFVFGGEGHVLFLLLLTIFKHAHVHWLRVALEHRQQFLLYVWS